MKEYWVNVFSSGLIGSPLSRLSAIGESYNMLRMFKDKTLYRIHVRLK